LLLATFFFYFMLGLSFKAALRTNLLLIAAYATAALLGKIAPTVAAYSLFLLLCANLIGGAGCYALEYANRVAFLERRRLAEVAAHDGLTGLLNRVALEEQARSLWQHARLGGLPVSVMLIDIDHFKAYNDHYGHPAGDRCLKEVATAIAGAARRRPLDIVARYGGEEIIAILVGSDRAEATEAAANVLRAVTELGIAHDGAAARSSLTVSVGVTTVASGGKYAHEDAVLLADIALYSAKKRGRNAWWYHSEGGEDGGAAELAAEPCADGLLRDAV